MISMINKGLDNMNEIDKTETNNVEMTAGEILRNARTTGRRKRELQTVAKQLCIREEFLQALEDGNYSVIPETVYILGFARNYAMELGLDPDEIVTKIKREMGLVPDERKDDDDESDSDDVDGQGGDGKAKHVFVRAWKFIKRNWLWFVLGTIVVVLIIGGAMFWTGTGKTTVTEPVIETNVAVSADTDAEPKYNADVRERFGTDNAATASVILQAVQESWVKVEDRRGNTVFSRVLVPGDIYYVPDGDGYTAVFGNAGGVDVWVNNVLAPKQGADHARVSGISLSPDDLMTTNSQE